MKTLRYPALALTLGVLALPVSADDDHEAAPMMAPAKAPVSEAEFEKGNGPEGRDASAEKILDRFRSSYAGEDQPRFAVFWNRELPDRVSDWRSNHRVVLGISGEASGTEEGEPTDIKGKGSISSQAEYRASRDDYDNDTAFALQNGVINTFREAGAQVVDQALAQRITDNKLEDGTFSRLSPDQARLQMRALSEHADYVLELNLSPDFEDDEQYQVRVLSVDDASVLATFATRGQPPESERDSEWVTTDSGYEKRERPVSMAEVGRELALETMEKMAP